MYVAENQDTRIQKFTQYGKFILKWGSNGTGNGQFSQPEDMAMDSSGNVYVVDSHRKETRWGVEGLDVEDSSYMLCDCYNNFFSYYNYYYNS
jgi:hypothetical protein